MQYTLIDVFSQAYKDKSSLSSKGDGYRAVSLYGVKIIKDDKTSGVLILNTMRGGEHYDVLKDSELNIFLKKGWLYGSCVLSLSNYRANLSTIEDLIKVEMNGKARKKKLRVLKESREATLVKYTKIKRKLNRIKL